jgi:hypothetical protein
MAGGNATPEVAAVDLCELLSVPGLCLLIYAFTDGQARQALRQTCRAARFQVGMFNKQAIVLHGFCALLTGSPSVLQGTYAHH